MCWFPVQLILELFKICPLHSGTSMKITHQRVSAPCGVSHEGQSFPTAQSHPEVQQTQRYPTAAAVSGASQNGHLDTCLHLSFRETSCIKNILCNKSSVLHREPMFALSLWWSLMGGWAGIWNALRTEHNLLCLHHCLHRRVQTTSRADAP